MSPCCRSAYPTFLTPRADEVGSKLGPDGPLVAVSGGSSQDADHCPPAHDAGSGFVPGFEAPFQLQQPFLMLLPEWRDSDHGWVSIVGPTGNLEAHTPWVRSP